MTAGHNKTENGTAVMRRVARRFLDRQPRPGPAPEARDGSAPALRGVGPGARVMTAIGDMPAAALRRRDLVRMPCGGVRQIEWIDRIKLDADYLDRHPDAQPVVIRAGALGPGIPSADLVLAPHQRLSGTQRFTGHGPGRPLPAFGHACARQGGRDSITYTMFHCGGPTSVLSEGVWLETAP